MSFELLTYAENRINNEEVIAGRIAVKLIKYIPGLEDKHQRTISLYGYVRALEDRVDNGIRPHFAFNLSSDELINVQRLLQGNNAIIREDFPQTGLVPLALEGLPENQRQALLASMHEIVRGINWDSGSIIEGKPLPRQQQDKRHLYASMSGFQMLSDLMFDRDLGGNGNQKVEDLFRTWVIYDALIDVRSDLSAGLVLFRESDLNACGIALKKGEQVPPTFKNLFDKLKPQIARDLVKNAKNIRETEFPKPFSYLLWTYFLSRSIKLARRSYSGGNIIFGGNSVE